METNRGIDRAMTPQIRRFLIYSELLSDSKMPEQVYLSENHPVSVSRDVVLQADNAMNLKGELVARFDKREIGVEKLRKKTVSQRKAFFTRRCPSDSWLLYGAVLEDSQLYLFVEIVPCSYLGEPPKGTTSFDAERLEGLVDAGLTRDSGWGNSVLGKIGVQCGTCRKKYRVPGVLAGKRVRCRNCRSPIRIPLLSNPVPITADRASVHDASVSSVGNNSRTEDFFHQAVCDVIWIIALNIIVVLLMLLLFGAERFSEPKSLVRLALIGGGSATTVGFLIAAVRAGSRMWIQVLYDAGVLWCFKALCVTVRSMISGRGSEADSYILAAIFVIVTAGLGATLSYVFSDPEPQFARRFR